MMRPGKWRSALNHPVMDWAMFILGLALIALSPIVGAIPGPGGIIVAGIGLGLVLKTSMWARRHYVRFKRWQPTAGRWADLALRRANGPRRQRVGKTHSGKPRKV